MHTNDTAAITNLRMPRQAAGINRSTAGTAAVTATGGVEAAGLFSWLGNLIGIDLMSPGRSTTS